MNRVILIIDDYNGYKPYVVLEPQKDYTKKELEEIGRKWITEKSKEYGYSRFNAIVTTAKQTKACRNRIKI